MTLMNVLALVAVVLLALLVGLAIPVLLQARATLRSAERFLDSTSTQANRALGELTQLTTRLNHVVGEVEGHLPRVQRVLDATDGVVGSVEQIGNGLRLATTFGPAAFAAIKAIFSSFLAPKSRTDATDLAAEQVADSEGMAQRAAS